LVERDVRPLNGGPVAANETVNLQRGAHNALL
jgi:hypothetical protein